ncbi:NAD-dependent protein deacylase sir2rp2 [Paraconiothyrium brasiliense]|uniref:NAD-dependent protein deacylase sir2rp2 n=1 Tax=Paraconiothyrium brasiliense TaxID=300254 RepID=A0ABR3S9Z6_9PLEO
MPKTERVSSVLRNSVSTASAAGGGARSSSWSQSDDETLIKARAQGLNWNQISPKHFPTKSANACRKRHERLMEKQNAEQWDGVRLDVLAEAYMEVRSEMWRILGAKVNEKWQLVEQKCMEKGLKNLTQAYRQAQRKQGTYEINEDSGVGISDLDEDANENPSPVLTDASNQMPLAYQQPTNFHPQQTRVPSIHSILQHPQLPQSILQQQNIGQHPMSYTSSYPSQH